MQLDEPALAWYNPAEQLTHTLAPAVDEKAPAKQLLQTEDCEDPVNDENCPAAQLLQFEDPTLA